MRRENTTLLLTACLLLPVNPTVARQRRTSPYITSHFGIGVTGFAVTARAIRGDGHLSRNNYSIEGSLDQDGEFVKEVR